ncbi:DUF2089 domain-containing protein [Thermotoga sp. KOL6]|uniref:DUF2089 domain-containing protein n=1 Tax=Thermotoga sp. KOL6 TaxID=126741 RepID=UPI000C7581AE|nr:DUF2089 family protein [Thermotoga sp. KOL6]PLV59077.1 hypothetical protein AS005_04785 [Thermotoga sp. KOL6]
MLPKCPVCGKEMIVTGLHCDRDNVTVKGRFRASPFDFLDEDDLEFVILFFRARGNLKEIERYTGQGYFALRGRLERILEKMKLQPLGEVKEEVSEEDLFKQVKEGKISVEEALELLKKRKKGGESDV